MSATAEWTLTLHDYTRHSLYCMSRTLAPTFAKKWQEDIDDTYSPNFDGDPGEDQGGSCSITVESMEELAAALTAFAKAGPALSCEVKGDQDGLMTWAEIGQQIVVAEIHIDVAALNETAVTAIRAARKLLADALPPE